MDCFVAALLAMTAKVLASSRLSGYAKVAFEHCGIGLQRAAFRIVGDRTALQYHNAVGKPQYLLRILLDDDGADATGACNRAQRLQEFLDDDGRQPLGRLVDRKST